ncbi:hypothetical protein BH09VER1_BH09VER1_10090 [soil metagenome]
MNKAQAYLILPLLGLVTLAAIPSTSAQTGTTQILAEVGDLVPNGGTIAFPGNFSISNGGAAFQAVLNDSNRGVYSATAEGFKEIFRVGQTAPGGGTIMAYVDVPRISSTGEVVSYVVIDNQDALIAGNGSTLRVVAAYNQAAPDGRGQLNSFGGQWINSAGDVSFWGAIKNGGGPLSSTNGIYIGNHDGTITQIARTGDRAPGETNTFYGFSNITKITDNKQVIVNAELTGPGFGTGNNYGLYRGSSSGLVKIARSYDAAPGSSLFLAAPLAYDINNAGTIVFNSNLIDGSGVQQGSGIYTGNGGALSRIAQTGQAAPVGGGTITGLSNANYINADGKVAFTASFSTSAANLLLGDGQNLTVLKKAGDLAPTGATFTNFMLPRANDTGTVAFAASLNGSQFANGIFLTDGIDTVTVAQAGSTINGKTIFSVGFDPRAFNDFQQIAYQAIFTDNSNAIVVFAPDLNWRGGSGQWDNGTNWTVSLKPGAYNEIGIAPTLGGRVDGPNIDTIIKGLTIGGNATGTTELSLKSGLLTVTEGVTVKNHGMLGGQGKLAGSVTVESGGTTYPGDPSTTTFSDVHYSSGSKAEFSIAETRTSDGTHTVTPGDGVSTGDYDQIVLSSNAPDSLLIDGGVVLQLDLSALSIATLRAHAGIDKYFVFNLGAGTAAGEFATLAITDGDGHTYSHSLTLDRADFSEIGLRFLLSYTGDFATNSLSGGHDVAFTVQDISVPEPGTGLLAGLGLALLLGLQIRRRSRALTQNDLIPDDFSGEAAQPLRKPVF